jgi:hypothetical protein
VSRHSCGKGKKKRIIIAKKWGLYSHDFGYADPNYIPSVLRI